MDSVRRLPVLVLAAVLFFSIAGIGMAAILLACGSSPPPLADGTHFGYVFSVKDGIMAFDPAQWFSADDAGAAAVADGVVKEPDDLADPFYVRNPSVEQLRLKVDAEAQFTLYVALPDTGIQEKLVSLQEVQAFLGDPLPAHITVSGGKVTAMSEQYIP